MLSTGQVPHTGKEVILDLIGGPGHAGVVDVTDTTAGQDVFVHRVHAAGHRLRRPGPVGPKPGGPVGNGRRFRTR